MASVWRDMTEERIPTLIPGDPIAFYVRFSCRANVRSVTATFENQETATRIVLTGEATTAGRMRGARMQQATLVHREDASDSLEAGRYRLVRLEAETFGGKTLDFDNPPAEEAFYFEEESDQLPRVMDRMFMLPEYHPNLPPQMDRP